MNIVSRGRMPGRKPVAVAAVKTAAPASVISVAIIASGVLAVICSLALRGLL